MEWDPKERDAWVADAQTWICDIIGVLDCKIELDPAGEISCVHVVAGKDREARHIVRDVESLLKARVQKDVYYKKISLVQMMGKPGDQPLIDSGQGSTKLGLKNVEQRLKNIYDEDHIFTKGVSETGGFKVEMNLPAYTP